MLNDQEAISRAYKQLDAERKNDAAMAKARRIVLNVKEKEIDAWQKAVGDIADGVRARGRVLSYRNAILRGNRAEGHVAELRKIVESHTIEIVKFKSGVGNLDHSPLFRPTTATTPIEVIEGAEKDPEYSGPRASDQAKGRGIRSGCPTEQATSAMTEAQQAAKEEREDFRFQRANWDALESDHE